MLCYNYAVPKSHHQIPPTSLQTPSKLLPNSLPLSYRSCAANEVLGCSLHMVACVQGVSVAGIYTIIAERSERERGRERERERERETGWNHVRNGPHYSTLTCMFLIYARVIDLLYLCMAMGHILDSHDCSLHNRPISTTKLYNPGS